MVRIRSIRDIYPCLVSKNYKNRFIGEYMELNLRIHKLEAMLNKSDEERGFTFDSPIHLLEAQLETMRALSRIFEIRATLENIEIPEVIYG